MAVIKNIIPPKGIRRNLEGSELLDYVEDDPYLFEEIEENGNGTDETSNESGNDDDNNDFEMQTEPAVEVITQANSSNTVPSDKRL